MTPENLINDLAELVVAHQDREALDLASRLLPEMAPRMTSEEITRVADLMHGAQMAVDLEEWDAANRKAGTAAQGSRSS